MKRTIARAAAAFAGIGAALVLTAAPAMAATSPGSSGNWHANSGGFCITTSQGTCYALWQVWFDSTDGYLSSTTGGNPTNFYLWHGALLRQAGTDNCATYTGPKSGVSGYIRMLTCDLSKASQDWGFLANGAWITPYVTGSAMYVTQNGPGNEMTTQPSGGPGVYQEYNWGQ